MGPPSCHVSLRVFEGGSPKMPQLRSWGPAVWNAWGLSLRKAPEPEIACCSFLRLSASNGDPYASLWCQHRHPWLAPQCPPLHFKTPSWVRERVFIKEMHTCSFTQSTHTHSPGTMLGACKYWFVFVQWLIVCQLCSNTRLLTIQGVDFNAFILQIG